RREDPARVVEGPQRPLVGAREGVPEQLPLHEVRAAADRDARGVLEGRGREEELLAHPAHARVGVVARDDGDLAGGAGAHAASSAVSSATLVRGNASGCSRWSQVTICSRTWQRRSHWSEESFADIVRRTVTTPPRASVMTTPAERRSHSGLASITSKNFARTSSIGTRQSSSRKTIPMTLSDWRVHVSNGVEVK